MERLWAEAQRSPWTSSAYVTAMMMRFAPFHVLAAEQPLSVEEKFNLITRNLQEHTKSDILQSVRFYLSTSLVQFSQCLDFAGS